MSHETAPDTSPRGGASTGTSSRTRQRPNPAPFLWLALGILGLVILAGGFSGALPASHADQGAPKVDIAYVSVVGEGPIARAWYDGAPSPGVQVQDALDHFAEQGYLVVRTTDALRNANKPDDSSFAIILQRVR